METFVRLFGPLDALHGSVALVVFLLVLVNMVTRRLAHSHYVDQYEEAGADGIARYPLHVASNLLLVLATFYYTTVDQYSGLITAVLVVGMVVTDFFEFESRKVEARRDLDLDVPKAAIGAWVLSALYVAWQVFLPDGPLGTVV